jgi:hypothetical protein
MNATPTYYTPAPGLGVPPLPGKLKPAIMHRIEMLGKLNDRHKTALDNHDRHALEELAIEYEQIGCPNLANHIRVEKIGVL